MDLCIGPPVGQEVPGLGMFADRRQGYTVTFCRTHREMSMSTNTPTGKLDRILADAQRNREEGYREKALKMYPPRLRPLRPGVRWQAPQRADRAPPRPQP